MRIRPIPYLRPMITEEELQQIAIALEKAEKRTTSQIEELEELTRPIAPENAIGRVSRMDAINNRSVNEEALRKARKRLQQLKNNRERLAKGTIEECTNCGQAIQAKRLIYMPESHTCIPCARRM